MISPTQKESVNSLAQLAADCAGAVTGLEHGWLDSLKTANEVLARARAEIERLSLSNAAYLRQLDASLEVCSPPWGKEALQCAEAVLCAVQRDIRDGRFGRLIEIVHADVFSDYLEMATYLHKEGFKDAAAVVTGSTLEAHLRNLCRRHSVLIERNAKPKKADQLNADLTGAKAYSLGDQKAVTAWLDLRNNAAHGKYEEYTKQQVELMVSGVRDFIARNPA
jgi:hypothetical protein